MRLRSLVLLGFCCQAARPYTPPVDTAGPLTVTIKQPALGAYGAGGLAEFNQPNRPATLPVLLENSSSGTITGKLRIGVIDHWKVAPAEAQPFSIGPHSRASLEFQISFSAPTYNANYPVHAYAEFDYQGARMVAHPVMILSVKQPNPPFARVNIPWMPIRVPPAGELGLWRSMVRRQSVRTEDSAGVNGTMNAKDTLESGPVVQIESQNSHEGISLTLGPRPPALRENVAAASVEYPVQLPANSPLKLHFANAVTGTGANATFVVTADDHVLFNQTLTGTWKNADVDLSPYAGRSIVLRLEARAANWRSTGKAWFAEPVIVSANPAPVAAARTLGRAGEYEIRVSPGLRGILDATISLRNSTREASFHGFRVRVLGDSLDDPRSTAEVLETRDESAQNPGHYRLRQTFHSWAGNFDVVSTSGWSPAPCAPPSSSKTSPNPNRGPTSIWKRSRRVRGVLPRIACTGAQGMFSCIPKRSSLGLTGIRWPLRSLGSIFQAACHWCRGWMRRRRVSKWIRPATYTH